MEYIGDADTSMCVISFLPVSQLERPVGFDSRHAFECEYVVRWLTRFQGTHPVTGQMIQQGTSISSVLHPLIVNGRREHVAGTEHLLKRAGAVMTRVVQEPVPARTKFTWDAIFGLIGSIVELYYQVQLPISFDSIAVILIAYLFISHYPVHGCLIVIYIACIFPMFWQIIQLYGVLVAAPDFHLFTVLFFVSKVVLDGVVFVTGSKLV